ncbi:Pre-mRNA-splicing factor cwc26 [Linnemannia schmuckeri]|uniref:Pre-mRNA-splicing factor cwc26 n=1 Tax=Linnemannia schmuckeri TaxID=64567 RepID=A0A9P5VC19_9FUNG|nr:Pre-mRNA-splicing factor cwc26 [Linnemannia schmuckeri]
MSSTQDYLKKYMSKPASLDEHKKRKLKKKTSTSTKSTLKKGNFAIHDEDEVSWTNAAASDSDDDFPVVEQPKAPVYKSNSSSWATVREGEPEPSRESVLKRNIVPEWDDVENEDERPSIAGIARNRRSPSPRSRSRSRSPDREAGFGLQSAEQVKREMVRQKEKEQSNRMKANFSGGGEAETIYRDARGRKVDRVQEKLEAAEAARKEIEKQERQMEWGKGLVQREAEEEKKRREQEEKLKPLARYKDDKDLNEELKERDRWNDPAAMFLSGTKKSKKSAPKFPLYQGNFPSNRFNIRPGYRWDGVDRSTGFEKDYIQRMNTRKNNAAEAHMWSVEDM